MNPDQMLLREQSDLASYCLQYWLSKNITYYAEERVDNKSCDAKQGLLKSQPKNFNSLLSQLENSVPLT